MKALYIGRPAIIGAAALMIVGTGCATKKHVRQVVAPIESRVGAEEKKSADQASAIGELENNVSRVDERAMEADKKAAAAGQAAQTAQQSADAAKTAAGTAQSRADQANQLADATRSRLGQVVDNIDNYKLVNTESILFGLNRHALTKESKAQLDAAAQKVQGTKNFVLEVQGFADATGSAAHNLALSQRRADSVVRYLTVQHNLPIRKISVLGVGEEDPNADNKTRDGRKQARRVDVKVFTLDLGGTATASQATR
jgi:outer membrane protein OmpA-like peptidoglycan-associated protein